MEKKIVLEPPIIRTLQGRDQPPKTSGPLSHSISSFLNFEKGTSSQQRTQSVLYSISLLTESNYSSPHLSLTLLADPTGKAFTLTQMCCGWTIWPQRQASRHTWRDSATSAGRATSSLTSLVYWTVSQARMCFWRCSLPRKWRKWNLEHMLVEERIKSCCYNIGQLHSIQSLHRSHEQLVIIIFLYPLSTKL